MKYIMTGSDFWDIIINGLMGGGLGDILFSKRIDRWLGKKDKEFDKSNK